MLTMARKYSKKKSRRKLKKIRLANLKRNLVNPAPSIELADEPSTSKTPIDQNLPETSDVALVELQTVSPMFFENLVSPAPSIELPDEPSTSKTPIDHNLPETSDVALVELRTVSPMFFENLVGPAPSIELPDEPSTSKTPIDHNLPETSDVALVELRTVSPMFFENLVSPAPSIELPDEPSTSKTPIDQNLPETSDEALVELQTVSPMFFENPGNQTYSVDECQPKPAKEITGRRIVNIVYFFQQLQQKHESLFKCDFTSLDLETEKRTGLVSYFTFKCRMCKKTIKVCTDDESNMNNLDVNNAAVSGIIASGIGYSQFEETMAAIDVPIFQEQFYSKIQDRLFDEWEATAVEAMERAAIRERDAAIQEGRLFKGIPVIDVFADGAWCKRSYGCNYKALSGIAAVVGRKFGEVLFIGVKNKYCLICARAEKLKKAPKEHVCYKNYEGSSSGMEATIICEGFKESISMYGLIYGNIVADGDSATFAKILASNPYAGYVVSKIECRNHLLRNMCNKLRALGKDTKYPKVQRKHITDEKVMSMRKVVTTSIRHNKDMPRDIGIKQIHEDVTNSLNHAYGDHRRCKDYCCSKEKAILNATVTELENSPFWFRLKVILNTLASKSRSLLEDVDTNAVERFNSIIAKFVGGKRINYASRRSYQARCSAAVVSYNTKRPIYTLHKRILGKSPRGSIKKLEAKKEQQRKRNNAVKRKKNRRKIFQKQNDYGPRVAAPDMSSDEYNAASADFMSNLNTLVSDRDGIQQRTTQQRESSEWLQIRRLMITASNFGAIIKRKKNFAALVNNILYKTNISSVASVAHGLKNEKFAIQQLSSQENILIEECGLFVDRQFPYIGATPDGVVGVDTIVEVKCPVAAFKNGIESAIAQNKVQILRYNKKNGRVTINKNSNWYYQVQGQLRVTGKKRCIFGIWGREDEKMEVLYVQKDDNFWKNEMEPKLVHFYNTHILPELVDSRRARGMVLRGSDK